MKYTLKEAQVECQNKMDIDSNVTIIKSMRSGKTLTILDFAKKKKYKSILWVVPFIDNILGLKDEMKRWDLKLPVVTSTYAGLSKFKNKHYDLIVLDECHRVTLRNYQSILNITSNKIICMTGTYPKSFAKKQIIEKFIKAPIVFRYTVKDAIDDGTVAPYKISLIEKELDTENNIYVNTSKYKFWTSEKKSYDSFYKKMSNFDYSRDAKSIMMIRFNAMRFLDTLDSTVKIIKKYIKDNKDKRVLIFVATHEMAEKCSEYCYYSGKDPKYFNMFQDETISHLVLVEKGSVGVTYKNLDGCLLTKINGSQSSITQKIFRTLLFRENYIADIKILINKDTFQKDLIKNALIDEG